MDNSQLTVNSLQLITTWQVHSPLLATPLLVNDCLVIRLPPSSIPLSFLTAPPRTCSVTVHAIMVMSQSHKLAIKNQEYLTNILSPSKQQRRVLQCEKTITAWPPATLGPGNAPSIRAKPIVHKPSQNQLSRHSVLTFLTVTLLDSHDKLCQYI